MSMYGQPPEGIIVRGHYHNFGDWHNWVSNGSGSSYVIDNVQPTYLDLSTVVCEYCGSRYLAEHIKSMKITHCLGCGSAKFHFERA